MKYALALLGIVSLSALVVYAQPPRPPAGPPPDPFLELFDTDENGELSASEIKASSQVLNTFDRNQDGKLTRDELPRPPRPGEHDRHHPPAGPPHQNPRENRNESSQRDSKQALFRLPTGSVVFQDGYETDPRDGGRPVVLIAAALGVEPEVFREAFSKVNPARNGHPSAAQARANKEVLMRALSKYGITNDRLDEVSNYYRYQPQHGELWTAKPARANAIIEKGQIVCLQVEEAGSGYSSPPKVIVTGHPEIKVKAILEFSQTLSTNGRIQSLELIPNNE
ncbi:MAG TPA: hypothetical protein DD473_04795 [Planctomycetaceae bacterium]|nr:hypothetical protein [Planctomycetaceae bacterium]